MKTSGFAEKTLWILSFSAGLLLAVAVALNDEKLWIAWSLLGDEKFYLVAGIILFFTMGKGMGVSAAVAVLFSGSLNIALKYSLNLPRPPREYWRAEASGPGFPSGHSQVSTSLWTSLTLQVKRKPLAVFSTIIVTGVSLSRVFLMVHYPLDVVGGVLAGLACGLASFKGLGLRSVKPWLQPLALTVVISVVNLVNGWEVSASQALLGLALSLILASRRIDHSMKILDSLSLLERFAMGLGVSLIAFLVYGFSALIPYGVLTGFFLLGVIMVFTPALYTRFKKIL
ncbi:phosphatase PAP2 family protein [Thermosphaera sp.]